MVNTEKIKDMCDWERKKAIFLLSEAEKLGMNTASYGDLAVNSTSGYTYLWLEDYNFSLYMPINCDLIKTDIFALWNCSECGNEEETQLTNEDNLKDIENRIEEIEKEHNEDAHNKEE